MRYSSVGLSLLSSPYPGSASSVSIAFGIRDTRFDGDKSHNASYTVKIQFSFVDNREFKRKRYLFFNDPALYIR